MPFHLRGYLEIDVPELAAANRPVAAVLPQNRVFLATVPPQATQALLIFARILPR
ncbi:hypothetical protein GGE46_004909 [Rhizobium etli]|uniref:Uncharacterized protein n=1 Tax=Rhizobium etli TaxID=29449 RepID=A0A7W6ZLY7_RHIET|nr:hypothetical protein [Rhizobium etli]MBB4538125.1 hypothetical protein [Rhizobium etli]